MRKYLHITLGDRSIRTDELHGLDVIRVGRHFIARTLLDLGAANVDPRSPENPLIFSAGPFAADMIYSEIEILAGQGRSLEDISEALNVPKGEVELVLKLKRLSAESATHKNNPSG